MLAHPDKGKAPEFPLCAWPVGRQCNGHFPAMQVQREGEKAQPAAEGRASSRPMPTLRETQPGAGAAMFLESPGTPFLVRACLFCVGLFAYD